MRISFEKRGYLLLFLSFISLIGTGGALLWLCQLITCHFDKGITPIPMLDAMLLSASSVSLTGLSSVPLDSLCFGAQLVILLLMQIGSIGIIVVTATILLLNGQGLSFGNTLMLSRLNDSFSMHHTENLIRMVASYTLIIEAVGMILLYFSFRDNPGREYTWYHSLWYALYYSVGSYCNGGIGPLDLTCPGNISNSFKIISWSLSALGGLGVYVLYDLKERTLDWHHHLRLHSKLVLCTSIALFILGALSLKCICSGYSWIDCCYMSTAARTSGYTLIRLDESLNETSLYIVLTVLMLIGGSPGSPAGGIKTTTLTVAILAFISSFRGNDAVTVLHRNISQRTVLRSLAIILLFTVLTIIGGIFLSAKNDVDSHEAAFEAASAISTTGLSIGSTTRSFDPARKALLILLMFIGRVGPVAALCFFIGRERQTHIRYPEERVIIG